VAVEDIPSRRGIAGTVFVHKIVGAKAAGGGSLEKIKAVADKVVANVRTMGVALQPCTVPAAGKPSCELEETEMETGIGSHGEAGIEKKEINSADEIAIELTDKILEDIALDAKDEVAVMVNGLGATPEMELFIVNAKVQEKLKEKGINVYKTFVGEYMTALEMAGCSISLLKLDDELKTLLDQEANAPAFRS